jgi:methionyl-tRNA formyltransferase
MSSELRIIFAGTPEFAAIHLQALLDSQHQLVAVYTQPDRPAGRGKKLKASPVKHLAISNDIPVYQPKSLRDVEQQNILNNLNADLMVVVAYGLILPEQVLTAPKYGCINVHASLLPRWRGAAPIQRAIEAGDRETGVTIMQMDAGLDTGDMLIKASCDITEDETAASLHNKLATIGAPALKEALNLIARQVCKPEVQNDELSCYAAKIDKAEAEVNWIESAETIERKIRAFNPFPIAFSTFNNDRVKIWKASASNKDSGAPAGTITGHDEDTIVVACGSGTLYLEKIQLPGGKPLSSLDILNSRRQYFDIGLVFGH